MLDVFPLNFTDPTGHREVECDTGQEDCGGYTPPPSPDPEPEPEEEIDDCLKPPTCEPWGPPIAGPYFVKLNFLEHNREAIDLYGNVGADLLAMGNGVVVVTGNIEGEEGYFVIIEYKWEDLPPYLQETLRTLYPDLDFGPGKSIYVQYQHMQKDSIEVSAGDRVSAGQVIGKQGGTGYVSLPSPKGDHLHIVVKVGASNSLFADDFVTGRDEYDWYENWSNPLKFKIINPNDIWKLE